MTFFLLASELSRLSKQADDMVSLPSSRHRMRHHDLSTAITKRQENNIQQLRIVIGEENPFTSTRNDLINCVKKCVIPGDVAQEVMKSYRSGVDAYKAFVVERITGDGNLAKVATRR